MRILSTHMIKNDPVRESYVLLPILIDKSQHF